MKTASTQSQVVEMLRRLDADPIVLGGEDGPSVVVCPKLHGRVMSLAFEDDDAPDIYLNEGAIERGFDGVPPGEWCNFGGAERIWLAPEGGPHGFMFESHRQTYDRYRFQDSHHRTPFQVVACDSSRVEFQAALHPVTASGAKLNLELHRTVELKLDSRHASRTDARVVAFETGTRIRNLGAFGWDWEDGLVSLWTLGQFYCRPKTAIVVPLRAGAESELGPPVCREYFQHLCPGGRMPDAAWEVGPDCLLLRGDASVQTKIDVWRRRAKGSLASIDLDRNRIILVEFSFFPDQRYLSSYWLPYNGAMDDGAAISVFTLQGTPGTGGSAPFYELETFSPAVQLQPGEAFTHRSRTTMIEASPTTLSRILQSLCGVSYPQVERFLS